MYSGPANKRKGALRKLDLEFEAMVVRMQSPKHQAAVDAIATLPLSEILGLAVPKAEGRRSGSSRRRGR